MPPLHPVEGSPLPLPADSPDSAPLPWPEGQALPEALKDPMPAIQPLANPIPEAGAIAGPTSHRIEAEALTLFPATAG